MPSETEERLQFALDALLDAFEACADEEVDPMPLVLNGLRQRGVELPPWVEMMV